jgi:hypothetical protein
VTLIRRTGATWADEVVRAGERVELPGAFAFDVSELYAVLDGLGPAAT